MMMTLRRTAVVMLVLASLAGCSRSPEQRQTRFLDAGKQKMRDRDYGRAALEFRNAIQVLPRNTEPHFQLALSLISQNRFSEAVQELRTTLQLDPHHNGASLKMAELMLLTADEKLVSEAAGNAAAALQAKPGDKDALFVMAATQVRLGKLEDAEKFLRESLSKHPDDLRSAVAMARLRFGARDFVGAEAVLQHAIATDPRSTECLVALGVLYTAMNKPTEAESCWRRALQIRPGDGSALLQLAGLLAARGDRNGAEQTYRKLSTSSDSELRSSLGMYYVRTGQLDAAVVEFKRLAGADPSDRLSRTRLVALFEAAGRINDAEAVLSVALKSNARDADALVERSRLFVRTGRIEAARHDLEVLLSVLPESADAHYLMGAVHSARGAALLERQALAEAVRLDPLHLDARIAYAELLIRSNQAASGLELITATPPHQKSDRRLAMLRGWAQISSGDSKGARRNLEPLLAAQRTPDALYQLAVLHTAAKSFEAAESILREITDMQPDDLRAFKALAALGEARNDSQTGARLQMCAAKSRSAAVHLFLGTWFLDHGQPEVARPEFERAKEADPSATGPDVGLARIEMIERKTDKARLRLRKALAGKPANPGALVLLASAEERLGNMHDAAQIYKQVLEVDPNNALALNNLACIRLKEPAGLDDALQHAQKAKELVPANPEVADTLGWIFYRKGLYKRALEELRTAAAANNDPAIRYHLGSVYLALGEKQRGDALIASAVRDNPELASSTP